jgi:hypothetical protein
MGPAPLSFVFFARDSARLAARKSRAQRAGAQLRWYEGQRDAERRWEGEGGNQPVRHLDQPGAGPGKPRSKRDTKRR